MTPYLCATWPPVICRLNQSSRAAVSRLPWSAFLRPARPRAANPAALVRRYNRFVAPRATKSSATCASGVHRIALPVDRSRITAPPSLIRYVSVSASRISTWLRPSTSGATTTSSSPARSVRIASLRSASGSGLFGDSSPHMRSQPAASKLSRCRFGPLAQHRQYPIRILSLFL